VRPTSNVTVSHQRVDVALSLCLVEAVFGHDLGHDIVLVLERGQIPAPRTCSTSHRFL
jgi:hypothetical protein